MKKYSWIGHFWYPHGDANVWVGFFEDKKYFNNLGVEHPNTFGEIIATDNTKYYKKNSNRNCGWYESSFEEVKYPTDPTLTYYVKKRNKYNTKREVLQY